ncbi:zinc-binding alcohol dehydrogenase family protein [Pseudomonas matsuisoli]|uniref:Zinc-type alcohol dehydrogenase-like protein n=1 Tax=Pseudomonas matsuisoli TaxID=1515666 RepID=A0A917PTU8_9PSED|nr:zinc-binding alcohol dehydrogenase family protein [Pseudomonas matsuisoli]GGJ91691.1 oxidoreductase [Pseudomonas matsuisoli]
MKAVGFHTSLPITDTNALVDLDLPEPVLGEHDLLVEVKAVSVNPVDTKVRRNMSPTNGEARVLGWDAAGIVRRVGAKATLFKEGDEVWYAGDLTRPGSNAQLHAVDERIVGPKPKQLDFAEAAALPLTAITAWELLFDRLKVQHADPTQRNVLLVVGAAGGVGSVLLQLARRLTGLTVIGTASRPETQQWALEKGAHHVIDHSKPWAAQLSELGFSEVSHVISLTHTDSYLDQIVEVLQPEGQMALIDDPKALDIMPFKRKSLSVHWELMFTRPIFKTPTLARQHALLTRVSELVDEGIVSTTLTQRIAGINAENLRKAHAQIESATTRGKIVLEGF